MSVVSAILYFMSQHSFLSVPVIWGACVLLAALLVSWTKNMAWAALAVGGMVLGMLNPFFGSGVNASFLNKFGTYGSAVITHSEVTNSQLNNKNIIAYEGVMKTADGRDVKFAFDTMSAPLYPWRNRIEIPPQGERFVVKYIPGFERNMAIMRDESTYGKRILMRNAREPIERAKAQLAVSPYNKAFQQEYVDAVKQFLSAYEGVADEQLVQDLKESINQPMGVVGKGLLQGGPDNAEEILLFLKAHGQDVSPELLKQLQGTVDASIDREARSLLRIPAGDEFYNAFVLQLEKHGSNLRPATVTVLLMHARVPVHLAEAESYKQAQNPDAQKAYLATAEKYIKQYGKFDPQYESKLKKDVVRLRQKLGLNVE